MLTQNLVTKIVSCFAKNRNSLVYVITKEHQYFPFIFSGCLPHDKRVEGFLDTDGLPPIGAKLETGNPYYW